jgi:hypothetical protein
MTDRTSLTLTDERRRLEDKARALMGDELPDSQFRAALYDAALKNLIETIENHQEYDGNPQLAKRFNTSVVRSHYRTSVDTRRPD